MPSTTGQSLLITLAVDFGIQFVFFVVSAYLQTERFYDGSGALTYFACTILALLVRSDTQDGNSIGSLSVRQILAATGVLVWCVRLGVFLFMRVQKHADHRFDELKKKPARFAVTWFLQFVWIFLTAFPVYILLANNASSQPSFAASDTVGLILWIVGFAIEVIADAQKSAFKTAHPNEFMQTGLFAYSRYPNYFGECLLWFGMFVLCARGFDESWQWVCVISPVFVFCLIYFVSGVRLLEISSEKRYGEDPEFIAYRQRTSKFVLWFPKKRE
ncbi:hypothetical protein HDU98_005420 [Podochytrium sp. JEL0797]|nr:hypothetical protein HDU98_005420 [Podochytrium sp. JEL0797]